MRVRVKDRLGVRLEVRVSGGDQIHIKDRIRRMIRVQMEREIRFKVRFQVRVRKKMRNSVSLRLGSRSR